MTLPFRIAPAIAFTAAIAAVLLWTLTLAYSADERIAQANKHLERIRAQFDHIEAGVAKAEPRPPVLMEFRAAADPLRAELRAIIADLEPVHAQAESRLKQLGPAPNADQPPEALTVASEREQQSIVLRDADAALRQARLLLVRGDQIVESVDRQRRAAFTSRLFERSDSFFSLSLWAQAASRLPEEGETIGKLAGAWVGHLHSRVGYANLALAALIVIAVLFGIVLLRRMIENRIGNGRLAVAPGEAPPLLPRSHKAVLATRDAILASATAPLAVFIIVELFSAFGMLPGAMRPIGTALVAAVVIFSIGRALTQAVLSPDDPVKRLPALEDDVAQSLARLITLAVAISAAALFLNSLHQTLTTSVSLTVATSALYAFLIALVIVITLLVNRIPSDESESGGLPPWMRLVGWTAAAVILIALAAGYVRFATLIAERVIAATLVLLALTLLLALIDALLGEGLKQDSSRRRAFANTLGLKTRTFDLLAALLAGLLRTLLVLAAIFFVIGTFTASAFDVSSIFDRAALSIQIGDVRIRLGDIFGAAIVLIVGIIVTRILNNWLSNQILPRTDLDPSLRNSVSAIAGYVGIIAAISIALAFLGVNLENIALVAGALSIGIGFGLQSIVSNFVSGLILLTERPIAVGDWIVVGNEQGYVRKISVRSTEIETFDRASVIVPNSDLITHTVKNWTHFNKLGRFSIPVGVSYDSDPEAVRALLLEIAGNHPMVLKTPPPAVFFLNFGDSALELDLRGFVADINTGFGTASDLRFEIFRRFREANIQIPFPQRDIHIRTAPGAGDPDDDPADDEAGEKKPARRRR